MSDTTHPNGRPAPSTPVRPEHIAALVGPLLEGERAEAVGVFAPGPWAGGETVTVGEREHPVVRCASPLAVREALDRYEREDTGTPPVLLVPFEAEALGWDVQARLAKRRLLAMAPWDVVRDLFRARRVDPRVVAEVWMAHVLMERTPAGGYPPVAGDVLDADTAWSHVLGEVLGVHARRPDVDALLAASVGPEFASDYGELSDDAREAVRTHIERVAGPLAAVLMAGVETGHGSQLLALGLACDVLFPEEGVGSADLDRAAVRLEKYVGGRTLDGALGRQWASAARRVLDRLDMPEQSRAFEDASGILEAVRAEEHAGLSAVLPSGYDRRMERLGAALADALDGRGTSREAASALACVEAHRWSELDEESVRIERLRMAVRLVRFLEDGGGIRPRSVAEAVENYVRQGSFVDWARSLLVGGDRDGGVAAVLDTVSDRVRDVREQQNRAFAEHFAVWNEAPEPIDGAVLIEDVLRVVVAPVAQQAPTFVLVLDGMGFASFRQLRGQLVDRGWEEWSLSERDGRLGVVAVAPSITRLSRTSLLSGKLGDGVARDEKRAFASAGRLGKASTSGKRPVLFHKGDLQEGATSTLSAPVRAALADAGQRVVGVVLNVLDDSLAKSDQQLPLWQVDRIRLLSALLEEARVSGRAVVVLSDHGHVLESDGTALPGDGQERWRSYAEPVADEEVVLSGPRVRKALGTDTVVVPWSERVRYVRKKAGYHGGASPQELIVPAAVFVPVGVQLSEGQPLRESLPGWWEAKEPEPVQATKGLYSNRTRRAASTVGEPQPTLFGAPPASTMARPRWAELVVQSDVYAAQRALAGRLAPADEAAIRALQLLAEHRGRTAADRLASGLSMAADFHEFVVSLQRVLNVDGYPILAYDSNDGHVRLDLDLLGQQFGVILP